MNIWLQELAVLATGGDQSVDSLPSLDLREHLVNENNSQRPEQLVFTLVYQPPSDFSVGPPLHTCTVEGSTVQYSMFFPAPQWSDTRPPLVHNL